MDLDSGMTREITVAHLFIVQQFDAANCLFKLTAKLGYNEDINRQYAISRIRINLHAYIYIYILFF